MPDLSILIPARNEQFLQNTVDDLLKNIRGNTEIIIVADGEWPPTGLEDHEDKRVTLVKLGKSIGQRAATNLAARLSTAKYVMKVDAHCAFGEGFDQIMISDMQDDITMVPLMKNLHVFDWVCDNCGQRWYQGPTPTKCESKECQSKSFHRDMVWQGKPSPNSTAYRFNKDLEFKYWGEYKTRQQGDLVETMSLQGSCFMMTRDKYWELDICDENWGSWGGQGAEVALKTWLSGGRVLCNTKTWYAHLFRTQGGDFGFPYPNPAREQKNAKDNLRATFLNDKWSKAKHSLNWLLEKFSPVPDWHSPDPERLKEKPKKLTKGVVYYTDNKLDEKIAIACRNQILKGIKEKHIVSVSLQSINFGQNIVLPLTRGYLTMAKQILAGLEALKTDIVYFCEHDVLYHPSHFALLPKEPNKYYYNTNIWCRRLEDGFSVYVNDCKKLSQLIGYRQTLIEHFKKRVEILEQATNSLNEEDFNRLIRKIGFEPGTHNRDEKIDDLKSESLQSNFPNIDIRHNGNLTPSRWSPDKFKNKRYTEGWTESYIIPGWESINII